MTTVYELRHAAPYMSIKALAAAFGHSDKWTRQAVREMQDVLLDRYSPYDIVGHGKRLLVNTAAFLDFLKFREMIVTYKEAATEQKKEYKKVTAKQMQKDLDANALNASKKYKDKYVAMSGKFDTVDSSGDYFTVVGGDDDIIGIMCNIDDKLQDKVSKIKKGKKVIVKGKVTDVGETLGYTMAAESVTVAK